MYAFAPDARRPRPPEGCGMATPLRLTLELDPAGDPLEGRLSRSDGDSRRFVGYLELLSALDALGTQKDQGGAGMREEAREESRQ